jgi:PhzF family phenazine biosynthesis protein
MKIPIYQVDAFTSELFKGNPAAVCPLPHWLPDNMLQAIAAENNLSETAFFVEDANGLRLRWFTPRVEVDLCGHATLATAHVLFNELGYGANELSFNSLTGIHTVRREGAKITLVFPSDECQAVQAPAGMLEALGVSETEVYKGRNDYLVVLENEAALAALTPDHRALRATGIRAAIATATSANYDFVSRFFAPGVGIDEDPVTGSAHTTLTPFWSKRLSKTTLEAKQISERGGLLTCTYRGKKVELSGEAVTYLRGEVFV